jgi:NAD(P)-dependent dehydrogenase (short-subunit alcohol dehydrogenase family)
MDTVAEMSPEVWDDIMKVNLYANFHIIQAAAPLLPPGASIVVTDSVAGLIPVQGSVAYAASKAALRSMINGVGGELIKQGIRINGVAPGYTYTPLLVYGGITLEDLDAQVPVLEPIGRVQQPAEIAPVYVTLADDQLSYGTGSIYGSHGAFLGAY